MSGLDRAISLMGGLSALASAIGGDTKPQHVNNWRNRGIPVSRVHDVVRATAEQVLAHELRPDVFPDGFRFPKRATRANP
jgi:DNA-binding transcriptional regulator YdaS (Cro superfamily)